MTEPVFPEIMLPTKLYRPQLKPRVIARPRLLERLDASIEQRVTLIAAPAGFGKTVLTAQWLDSRSRRSAWLSLDEQDNALDRFVRHVIAALHTVAPDLCKAVERLLAGPVLPPAAYLADALVVALLALNEPLVLVLDDYHTVTTESVQMLMMRLVQQQPDNVHLVILTRVDPPWPLALWRVRQWLCEVRAVDLCFSEEETRAFFACSPGSSLAAETVHQLQRHTEGWIAALQLVQLSLSMTDNPEQLIRNLSVNTRSIADFLMEEVLSHQPSELQQFLSVTSLFERFCVPLCAAVLAEIPLSLDSQELLTRLERDNLFLVALDGKGQWYRYHHLFRSFLAQHLQAKMSPTQRSHLHRHAGTWFAGEGLIEEALRHLLAAGEVETAAALVECRFRLLVGESSFSGRDLQYWLAFFTPETLAQRPALLVAQAYQYLFQWDYRRVAALLDQTETLLQDPAGVLPDASRQHLRGDIATLYGSCLFHKGDMAGVIRHARRTRRIRQRENGFTYLAYALSGQRDEALHLLAQDCATDAAHGSRHRGRLMMLRMYIDFFAGDVAAVEQTAQQVLALQATTPISDLWRSYGQYFLGRVAYERNHLETAAGHLGQVAAMSYQLSPRLYHDTLLGLARIAQARGDATMLRHYADGARAFAFDSHNVYSRMVSQAFELRFGLCSGDRLGTLPLHPPSCDTSQVWLEIPTLTLAEYLVSTASPEEYHAALKAVEEGLQAAYNHHHTRLIIQFQAVHALALDRVGTREAALQVLEQALRLAEPLGFVRTFVDRGPVMAQLLQTLVHRCPESRYVHRLLAAFAGETLSVTGTLTAAQTSSHHEAAQPTAAVPADGLSNRESDVLFLLASRLSNKEIAVQLGISVETVKGHTKNLYRKLDVHGRRQAVATARQRGLLLGT